jgi:hypothetical protein
MTPATERGGSSSTSHPGPAVRRRQAERRGLTTKAQAQAALDELRVAGRQGAYVPPARQRLGDYLTDEWLPAIRGHR